MEKMSKTAVRERVIAVFLTLLGMFSLLSTLVAHWTRKIESSEFLLAFLFSAAIILACRFPIHIFRGTKVSLINLPIYLSAVLLPAPLAVLVTGTGLLVANFAARIEYGLLPRDIASSVGQWMFTVLLGNYIVHENFLEVYVHPSRYMLLLLCALTFLLLDFLMFSASQAFISGEPFLSMLKSVIREGLTLEVIQYLIAILGTLAAHEDIWSLFLLIVPIAITYVAFKNIKETRHETVQILADMADTVDLRDIYTGGHSKRVADLVSQTLAKLQISGPEAILIEISARLHDIGKIGIPDSILMKPGKLLSDEMTDMQTHSEKGADLIAKYKDFARGAMIIKHHHERWDGSGYPSGLKAYEIPFGARVVAVADSFDAMISDRPYRSALSRTQAIEILLAGRGKQWDASIVNAFVEMITRQLDDKPEVVINENLSRDLLPASLISPR